MRICRHSFQGIGCFTGCLLHLVFLGVMALAGLVWLVKIRVWELSVTVEMPAGQKAVPDADRRAP